MRMTDRLSGNSSAGPSLSQPFGVCRHQVMRFKVLGLHLTKFRLEIEPNERLVTLNGRLLLLPLLLPEKRVEQRRKRDLVLGLISIF